jgi:LuxR family maltose regulon positive regulatory protein
VVAGWHSFRAAALCLRATFGLSDADAGRSARVAAEAIALETGAGAKGHPSVRPALGAALGRDGRFAEASELLLGLWPERESWPSWIVLQVSGTLAFMLADLGRDQECDRILREVAPLAAAVERDRREASTPGLAALRIAEGRRRYQRGDAEEAAVLLRRAVDLAALHPRPTMVLMSRLYLADAELARGDRAAARAELDRAREVADDEPVSGFARERLEASENRIGRGAARVAQRAGVLAEELTDRELSILRALQGTASQREIGAALFLSVNTVKAYTKSLYRKLGVASRQEAVASARRLGLV